MRGKIRRGAGTCLSGCSSPGPCTRSRTSTGTCPGPAPGIRSRPGGSAHPEQDALRSAVGDKLPDAEIKVRLARAHEVFQQNEALLLKVQTELRAILTVRQEAVAVMAGLLPP